MRRRASWQSRQRMRVVFAVVLLAGCKTAANDTPDAGQPATCTFFLASGNVQPPCSVLAGDLAASGNGHVKVTLVNHGVLSFGQPMDFMVRGALASGIYRFGSLLPDSIAGVTVAGDQGYLVSPNFHTQKWGDAVLELGAVNQLPATLGDTTLSTVAGLVELKFTGLSDHKATLAARVTF